MNNQINQTENITSTISSSLLDLPSPSSISLLWNIGFLLGIVLTLQITSGIILSILYSPSVETAFSNIISISQDIKSGWITRTIHANGASLFFILLYTHTARGIYFNSPTNNNNVWISGTAILIATIATAFLGYVLPWGQISFWGATVITGVLTAIPILGNELVTWIWGGPSVSNPTLNRFFSLHFLLPLIITAIATMHLVLLHEKGSSQPSLTQPNTDNLNFNPSFSLKDSIPAIIISILLLSLLSTNPYILGDVENFNPANPLIAPPHIQPEWYFLFAYVILRSIPSNLGGVIALVLSIIILLFLPTSNSNPTNFNPPNNINFWFITSTVLILTWIGSNAVEPPFEGIGQIYTILYFISITTI